MSSTPDEKSRRRVVVEGLALKTLDSFTVNVFLGIQAVYNKSISSLDRFDAYTHCKLWERTRDACTACGAVLAQGDCPHICDKGDF